MNDNTFCYISNWRVYDFVCLKIFMNVVAFLKMFFLGLLVSHELFRT